MLYLDHHSFPHLLKSNEEGAQRPFVGSDGIAATVLPYLHWGSGMTDQRYRVTLPVASPSEIERTARQLMAIRENFLAVGKPPQYAPRRIILDSWLRCNALHVNAARRCAPLAVAREAQLRQIHEANEPLMRAATPVINHLSDFLADSGYVIVLSDTNGRLLDVVGDRTIRRRLARIDFIPGGDWSESAAGTNAIGTALATGHAVQLMAAEHYCDGWQDLTCTAVPIRHPLSDEVIGILDVTGDYRLIRPFLTGYLTAAALEIKQNLRTLLRRDRERSPRLLLAGFADRVQQISRSIPSINQQPHPPTVSEQPSEGAMHHWSPLFMSIHERRARDAERLAAAACTISASLDLPTTLDKVAEQTARLFQLDCAAVCLFNEQHTIAAFQIYSQCGPTSPERRRMLETLIRQTEEIKLIRERGEPLIADDLVRSNIVSAATVEQVGIRALALLPLATARGVIGFLAAPRPGRHRWEADEIRLGLALAAQAATSVENAHLFASLQQHTRHIEALNAMAQFLSTLLDPGQRLDLVLERITAIMELDAGMVLLREQNTGALTLTAHCRLSSAALFDQEQLLPASFHQLTGWIAETGQSLLICDMAGDAPHFHQLLHIFGFCDLMIVPLVVGSTTLGVLIVGSHSHRELTNEDLTLFTTIGQQLGLALKNAQLLRAASEMEALREADRLKSEFLAAVSHDLRSPLTAIRASVDSLLDRGWRQSALDQEQLLHNIAGQAGRLGRLVDQLLDLSRIEAGALALDRDWTELPALIADIIARFEELNSGCRIKLHLPDDLPLQYVDPDRLTQVLWNLLENAFKYAPSHSLVTVEARRNGSEILMSVADRGPGIPIGEREKIFQHFYRIKQHDRANPQGSGLGLAICHGIVEAHGGRLWVEDRIGGGSVFCIALPLPTTDPAGFEALEEPAMLT
jgi:two-component system sensor histidine kinase KdpD